MLSTHNDNNIANPDESTLKPIVALVFFGKDKDSSFQGVTRHNIQNNLLGSGEYVTPEQVKLILDNNSDDVLSLRSPYIIAENSKHLLWYSPARFDPMWFKLGKDQKGFKVHWPTLLFVANKVSRTLNVFALESDTFPENNTQIFHAPLMNIGTNGSVCQGTAKLPEKICQNTMSEIEDTIYQSNFTHVNHKSTLKQKDKPAISTADNFKFWQRKSRSKSKINKRSLVPYITLTGLISKLK